MKAGSSLLSLNLYTMMHTREQKMEAFGRLLDIMDELRVKCPWDAKQTNESLRTNTIEEVYELCEAIIQNSDEAIKKELGDVLLHVVFYAKIGEEKGTFDVAHLCHSLCDKLIYRHPHVFVCIARRFAAARRSFEQAILDQIWFIYIFNGPPVLSYRRCQSIQSHRTTVEFFNHSKEDSPVCIIQPQFVHPQGLEFFLGRTANGDLLDAEDFERTGHVFLQKRG